MVSNMNSLYITSVVKYNWPLSSSSIAKYNGIHEMLCMCNLILGGAALY